MTKPKGFPKEVWVTEEEESHGDDTFLQVHDPRRATEGIEHNQEVAIYKFVGTKTMKINRELK